MIEFRDIYKAFDSPVLAGVNLTIHGGERLSIIGPSGTGKSVLLKTTIGLITPDKGEVLIDGESIFSGRKGHLEAVRQQVRYVFQYAALFDSMTVLDNVMQGLPESALKRLSDREILRKVAEALEEVNLDPAAILAKRPAELSGGMRKRVGIARAIVAEPRILLYDEPVTGLDPINAAAVSLLIRQIADRSGVTSVIVTHDIEGALEISDRIALLEGGRLHFVGTPEEFRVSDEPLVRAFADRKAALAAAARLREVP